MTAQLPSKEMLSQTIERITDAIDDVVRLYGEHWDSALVGGEPNYHAITNEQAVVVRTADDSLHSSWLCDYLEAVDPASVRLLLARIKELDKAAHEQEPVAYAVFANNGNIRIWSTVKAVCDGVGNTVPLYTHPAPSIPADLHPDTQKLVADFSAALAEKLYKAQLKYGYSDNWKRDGWAEECLQHFHQHISKGDPRDVAAYCAFMWFHG
jgi:hypothetical protein